MAVLGLLQPAAAVQGNVERDLCKLRLPREIEHGHWPVAEAACKDRAPDFLRHASLL